MTKTSAQIGQATAARIAGGMYLLIMATGIFGESIVRGSLVAWSDAAQTAENISRAEPLFRAHIATELITYSAIIVKIWALYLLLNPVGRGLALLGVLFGTAEVAVAYVATLCILVAQTLLSGAGSLKAVDPSQLQTLALVAMRAQGHGLGLSFVLTGLGSAVFAYLLARSGYVPKVLAVWGVFANLLLAMTFGLAHVFPAIWQFEYPLMTPAGIYEIALGSWLLLKGVKVEK